jgi:amino acid transporter
MEKFEFAGWGEARKISDLESGPIKVKNLGVNTHEDHKLGTWSATAICGNDITSSCLYVSALSIMAAGAYAPLALLVVALVLFLFRKIYAEVGSALPLNGGTYTVLLNTTNKKLAAGAACLTLLSYIATAVISAGEAMHYAHELWHGLNITVATLGLLSFFAFLNILGISESAKVALSIFIIHLVILSLLVITGVIAIIQDPTIINFNFQNPLPEGRGFIEALFLGFAAAMLGISGFESSANFIEEQKPGVFPKTLRNMWMAVSFFNPVICLLALGLLNQPEVAENKTNLLAVMADRSAGTWLKLLVSIDAVLVLSGAVLTSYVGVIGLVRRMTLDRCLPDILLKENNWRKTNHWIVISFLILCCAIFLITHGDVSILAGVYTLSFLCVMALFSIGNMLLKRKRSRLPRAVKAKLPAVVFALAAVLVGLAGNLTEENIKIFGIFFGVISAIIIVMFLRVTLLRLWLFIIQSFVDIIRKVNTYFSDMIRRKITVINGQKVIYFTKGDDLANLNQAALYVLENEDTNNLMVVNVYEREKDIPNELAKELYTIDHIYPQLRIDFLAVKGTFGPEIIERLSKKLNVPKNYMFIGTPGDRFPHNLTALGGVRLIL